VGIGVAVAEAWATDLLEHDLEALRWAADEPIELELRPFEVVTLRVRPA
jgi:alpha-mannosidase